MVQHWKRGLKPLFSYALWTIAIGLIALGIVRVVRDILKAPNWPGQGTDLSVYFSAARHVAEGQSPYLNPADPANPYGYPPLFADLIALLRSVLGEGMLWAIWPIASAAALFASIALMMRSFGWKAPWVAVAGVFGLLINGHITRSDLFHGQPHFFLILLILTGIIAFQKGRALTGALTWAAVIVCKPFAGIFVLALVRRGQYREAIYTLGASAGLFVASFLPFAANAVDAFKGWIDATRFHTSFPNVAKPTNEAFNGFFTRIFSETPFSSPWIAAPGVIPWLAASLTLLALTAAWFSVSGKAARESVEPEERGARDMVEFSAALGFILCFGPLMEGPHVFMLLPGLFGATMIAERRWRLNAPGKALWLAAALCWTGVLGLFLIPFENALTNPFGLGHLQGAKIILSLPFGLAVAAGCVASLVALRADRAWERHHLPRPSFVQREPVS